MPSRRNRIGFYWQTRVEYEERSGFKACRDFNSRRTTFQYARPSASSLINAFSKSKVSHCPRILNAPSPPLGLRKPVFNYENRSRNVAVTESHPIFGRRCVAKTVIVLRRSRLGEFEEYIGIVVDFERGIGVCNEALIGLLSIWKFPAFSLARLNADGFRNGLTYDAFLRPWKVYCMFSVSQPVFYVCDSIAPSGTAICALVRSKWAPGLPECRGRFVIPIKMVRRRLICNSDVP